MHRTPPGTLTEWTGLLMESDSELMARVRALRGDGGHEAAWEANELLRRAGIKGKKRPRSRSRKAREQKWAGKMLKIARLASLEVAADDRLSASVRRSFSEGMDRIARIVTENFLRAPRSAWEDQGVRAFIYYDLGRALSQVMHGPSNRLRGQPRGKWYERLDNMASNVSETASDISADGGDPDAGSVWIVDNWPSFEPSGVR